MYRPNRVRPSRKLQTTSTTSTTSTTHGSPRTATATPRLVLPISTRTTPATTIAPTFSQVTLAGGAHHEQGSGQHDRDAQDDPAGRRAHGAALDVQQHVVVQPDGPAAVGRGGVHDGQEQAQR